MTRSLRSRAAALMAGSLISGLCPMVVTGGPGDADPAFKPSTTLPTVIFSVAAHSGGKLIVGGDSINVGGDLRGGLMRLNSDGTLDRGFDPRIEGRVCGVVVQEDGILVGGRFLRAGEKRRQHLVRVNADGTLDASIPIFANEAIDGMAAQADGKIIVVGQFTEIGIARVGGKPRKGVARLNPDGTLDESFKPQISSTFACAAVQADGKILIAGQLKKLGDERPLRIARLNTDGTLDTDFNPHDDPSAGGQVMCMSVQADGKILAGGGFISLGGRPNRNLARLHPDGTPDADFNPNPDGSVNSMVIQADGRILISGEFNQVSGGARRRIARLEAGGALDTNFTAEADDTVLGMVAQADGKVVIGGSFQKVGGAENIALARLQNVPATQSLRAISAERIEWLRGASVPETLHVSFELSTDGGASYRLLGKGTRMAGGWELTGLSLPDVGKIRARARTTGGYMNGSGGLVEAEAAYSFLAPQIVVKGNGAVIAGGDAAPSPTNGTDYGSILPGSTITNTFTIENPGTLDLNLTGTPRVMIDDAHMEEFLVATEPGATIPPAGSATFKISYRPKTRLSTATVSIGNDAGNQTPFRFTLRGSAAGTGGNVTTTPSQVWTRSIDGPGNAHDSAEAVTTDASGNVIIGGSVYSAGNSGSYTAKHEGRNGTLIWERHFPVLSAALAVDASGNVIAAGTSGHNGNDDFYIGKFAAADGAVLWEKHYNGPANGADQAKAVAVDADGNVIVGGVSGAGAAGSIICTVKYAAADGAVLWTRTYDGPGNGEETFGALAVYGNGDVIAVGTTDAAAIENQYAARYAAADGAVVWEKLRAGAMGAAVGLDANGNAVVAGYGYAGFSIRDIVTVKYTATGALVWEERTDAIFEQIPPALAVDAGGNVFIGGRNAQTGYIAKLAAASGALLWGQTSSLSRGRPHALLTDPSGNVVAIENGGGDIHTIAYDGGDGSNLWNDLNGAHSGVARTATGLARDPAGNVIVAGRIAANGNSTDMLVYKLSSAVALPRIAVEEMGTTVVNGGRRELGSIHLGGRAFRGLEIKNIGPAELELTGMPRVSISGADMAAFQISDEGVSPLAGGTSTHVGLTFHPQRRGIHAATLSIGNNDGGETPFQFQVRATATLASGDLTTTPAQAWTQNGHGPGNEMLSANAVVTDASGNVITTGASYIGSNIDYYTAKRAAATGALIWERRFNGAAGGADLASAVVVDGSGNVIVTGTSHNGSNEDYVTVKYAAADGATLWEKRYNGPTNGPDFAGGMVVDGDGNVIVGGALRNAGAGDDIHTLKYAAADGAVLWERRYDSPDDGDDTFGAMAVYDNGDVIVVGSSSSQGGDRQYAARYAASGGTVVWETLRPGAFGQAVGLDAHGNAVVTGYGHAARNISTVKYTPDGAVVWQRQMDATPDGMPVVLAVQKDGNAVIGGRNARGGYTAKLDGANGALMWEQPNNFPANRPRFLQSDSSGNAAVTGNEGEDIRTIAYDGGDGSVIWENLNGAESSVARTAAGLARDPAGNLIVTGGIANGSTEELLVYKLSSAVALPRIALEQGGESLADHGRFHFDDAAARTFTVRNIGAANLTGLTIGKSGAQAGDFTVSAPAATSIAAGGSTTFSVQFATGGAGARAAELQVSSDDDVQGPLKVHLTGPGAP